MNQDIKDLFHDETISDEVLAAAIQQANGDANKVAKSLKALGIGAGSKGHLDYMRSIKSDVMRKHGFTEATPQTAFTGEELANPNWSVKQFQEWNRARRIKAGYKPNPLENSQDAIEYFKKLRGG